MNEIKDPHATFTSDDEPANLLESGTILASKFELIERIGQGGQGVVWKAKDNVGNRLVALKFVPNDLKRFETEMKRVRESFGKVHALHHPAICPLYSLENDYQLGYYLVMRFLEGETLNNFLLRIDPMRKGLPLESVIELLTPVAEALDYAHRNRVIHRDIKPSNIFRIETARGVEVQVIDFGLADEIKSSMSRVSQAQKRRPIDTSGTRPYMAPEQWRGWRQSEATDQYALAVVAYELLSGHLPFEGNDHEILKSAVINELPQPIREVSEQVNAALLKALAKESVDRFATCAEFISALGGAEIQNKKRNNKSRNGAQRNDGKPAAPGVESLMKRAHLFLEDSDWQQAAEYFNKVLDIDPEYAPAYVGLLCVELKVEEKHLGDNVAPISKHKHFQKALRFADDEYRATIEGYDEKIRERLRQEQYDKLVVRKNRATEKELPDLANDFRSMNGYKDTVELADECDEQYRVLKEQREERLRQEQYDRLIEEKNRASELDLLELARRFREMDGYKDTAELAYECGEQYRALKEQREEEERIERERQEQYVQLTRTMTAATTESEYRELAEQFRAMAGYRNTAKLAEVYDSKYRTLKENRELQERELQERYDFLVQKKDEASTEDDWRGAALNFRLMMDYKDTTELADECVRQYRILKEQREERQRIERERYEEQARKELEERERREEQEQIERERSQQERYDRLVQEMKEVSNEFDWYLLAAKFREMKGYKDAIELASICDSQWQKSGKKYKQLMAIFQRAEQGNAEAQFDLGVRFDDGKGVRQNQEEAVKWYRKAAEQGHTTAQYNLGVSYYNGEGVPENEDESADWFYRAARWGHEGARKQLQKMGRKVPTDLTTRTHQRTKEDDVGCTCGCLIIIVVSLFVILLCVFTP